MAVTLAIQGTSSSYSFSRRAAILIGGFVSVGVVIVPVAVSGVGFVPVTVDTGSLSEAFSFLVWELL